MAKILSFANQKGGVGKTTSCVNVAACLGVQGFKVLLIDMDPQGNSTSGVGISKKSLRGGVREMLSGKCTAEQAIVETKFENLFLIPTNTSLSGIDYDLLDVDDTEYCLKNALAPVVDRFDYILIDCPPSLSTLTINAFTASDGVIVPMQAEFYALEGLAQLVISIKNIKKMFNPDLELTGILLTMYNPRLLLTLQVVKELEKYYKDQIFDQKISRSVKLSEAPSFGKPIYYHDKNCKSTREYKHVASELVSRM